MLRLRITVKDKKIVDKVVIKSLGAAGVFEKGIHIQAVFGMRADTNKEEMKVLMKNGTVINPTKANVEKVDSIEETATSRRSFEQFASPCAGTLMRVEDIPDEVFSSKMMGDGIAIEIEENLIVAPSDGEVMSIFPTKHAIALKDKNNCEVLIHLDLKLSR